MKNYKYLGKKVEDIGKKGLDNIKEYYDIANAIIEDYKKGRISKRVAEGRLLLLYRLSFKKNNKKIENIPNEKLTKLRKYLKKLMRQL